MKKALPILASLVLSFGLAVPQAVFATVGFYPCNSDAQCNLSGEPPQICNPQTASCELTQAAAQNIANGGNGNGAGGLNTMVLSGWANSIVAFINAVLVPLLTAIAFIVFLWGVYNYFIWGADSEEKRKEGKTFVLYGIIGFVIIFSLWGLVNVGTSLLNVGVGGRPAGLPYPTL